MAKQALIKCFKKFLQILDGKVNNFFKEIFFTNGPTLCKKVARWVAHPSTELGLINSTAYKQNLFISKNTNF